MPQNKTKSGGFQNYLHSQGRSGLDPLDTSRTAASIEGWFLRRLFTLKLRTRNIFSLILMLLFGIGTTGFIGLAFYGVATTPLIRKPDPMEYLMFTILFSILCLVFCIGIALLINFGINLGIVLGYIKAESNIQQGQRTKENKKKMPKRRKDFK
ncbi:MAG: hypothetical protein DPW18_11800 [Chloroflexi bacterium]|nr:MAG: hypothetical protein EDM79_13665 [Chloroflexota bacterium]MCQ3937714.1 hypothetical protein [Chloroflexota bacterium]MDL1941074.1 hypothetical protein [Chloroflexi bacterium CFX2]